MSTTRKRVFLSLGAVLAALALAFGAVAPAGAATPQNVNYVRALYASILDRADLNPTTPDGGINYWANRLDTGESRTSIVANIMFAPPGEYFGFQVNLNYNLYLNRDADTGGFNYFVNAWRSGAISHESVVIGLVASNEYLGQAGGNLDGFVNKAYFDILGREPDSGGFQYFRNIAQTQGRARVAAILTNSNEVHRAEVIYKYDNFLKRPVDPGALTYWTNARNNGLRFETFDILLVSSDEYYNKNITG